MSEQTKRQEAAVQDEKFRPLEDAEAEKIVGGTGDETSPDGSGPDGEVGPIARPKNQKGELNPSNNPLDGSAYQTG